MKKTICIVSQTIVTCASIIKEFNNIFGEYLEIIGWSMESGLEPKNHERTEIYLVTSNAVLNKIKHKLKKDYIIISRTLNFEKIHKLLELEKGTNAILVQNNYEMSIESINIIKNVGIEHINLLPYYPSQSEDVPSNIKTAITTGMSSLVPPQIKTSIDLGTNTIAFSVYSNIVHRLNLPEKTLDAVSREYISHILQRTVKSINTLKENQQLKARIEVILNSVNEGIIAIDSQKKIISINSTAEKILNLNDEMVLQKNVDEVFPEFELGETLNIRENSKNEIIKYKSKHYVINKNLIVQHGTINGVVASLHPVADVKKAETKIRQTLKDKGQVAKYTFQDILGNCQEIHNTIKLAKKFSNTNLNILLVGESGTGKELFAQSIHNESTRYNKPFVPCNFAALTPSIMESELFGYEEGAFTGAKKGGKIGLFEEAHTGTLFIDEIGDISLDLQKKILRVLEEREVRKLGSSSFIPIDVRIIAATNKNLNHMVKEGTFREDLFFRLCTLPINIPSLKKRSTDIPFLINYFAKLNYNRTLTIPGDIKEYFDSYNWPGNIRELQNIVDYMCNTLGMSDNLTFKNLPYYMQPYQLNISVIEKNNSNLYKTVLAEIYSLVSKGKKVGRNSIKNALMDKGLNISEAKIKKILNELDSDHYIKIGKTKQGSTITTQGKAYLGIKE